jgi:hypothetical protein
VQLRDNVLGHAFTSSIRQDLDLIYDNDFKLRRVFTLLSMKQLQGLVQG